MYYIQLSYERHIIFYELYIQCVHRVSCAQECVTPIANVTKIGQNSSACIWAVCQDTYVSIKSSVCLSSWTCVCQDRCVSVKLVVCLSSYQIRCVYQVVCVSVKLGVWSEQRSNLSVCVCVSSGRDCMCVCQAALDRRACMSNRCVLGVFRFQFLYVFNFSVCVCVSSGRDCMCVCQAALDRRACMCVCQSTHACVCVKRQACNIC